MKRHTRSPVPKSALVFLLCLPLGCARREPKPTVGFSQMENNSPFRIAETNSMKAEGRERTDGFSFISTDAHGDTAKQVADVEDLVARRVSAIFLAPREFEGLAPALETARQAKIPVFLIDRQAAGVAGLDYVTFLGSDFVQQGQCAGDWLVTKSSGSAGIVELTGTAGSSVALDRAAGFRLALRDHPGMKILGSQNGDFTRSTGQKVMENLLQAFGPRITAVYAHNDEMALGAIQALRSAGRRPGKDVLIVSIDGEKAALQAIISGDLNAVVESNPRFGPLAFDTLERFRRGEKLPPRIMLQDRFFDAANARQFVDAAF